MAGLKNKSKKIKQKNEPKGNVIVQRELPEKYYDMNPSWRFSVCDKGMWSFSKEKVGEKFWEEILPYLQGLELQTWGDILVGAKKQNHSIDVTGLNKIASDRLENLCIEAESIISLRITGKHRIYGYMSGSAFQVLWVDFNHGDNKTCVCRSHMKHT